LQFKAKQLENKGLAQEKDDNFEESTQEGEEEDADADEDGDDE
jgi:hypothetical protein